MRIESRKGEYAQTGRIPLNPAGLHCLSLREN